MRTRVPKKPARPPKVQPKIRRFIEVETLANGALADMIAEQENVRISHDTVRRVRGSGTIPIFEFAQLHYSWRSTPPSTRRSLRTRWCYPRQSVLTLNLVLFFNVYTYGEIKILVFDDENSYLFINFRPCSGLGGTMLALTIFYMLLFLVLPPPLWDAFLACWHTLSLSFPTNQSRRVHIGSLADTLALWHRVHMVLSVFRPTVSFRNFCRSLLSSQGLAPDFRGGKENISEPG